MHKGGVGAQVEDANLSVTLVTDQQIAGERAERTRRDRQPPRLVKRSPGADPCEEIPRRTKSIDDTRSAFFVGDVHNAVQDLDVVRNKTGGEVGVLEVSGQAGLIAVPLKTSMFPVAWLAARRYSLPLTVTSVAPS